MAFSRGFTEIHGNFKSQARLVAALVDENSLVFVNGKAYTVDAADAGDGVLLNNGLYANPVVDIIPDIPNNKTGTSYTLQSGDEGKTIWMNNAAANTLTIPLDSTFDFDINTVILVMMEGAGITSITATAGVTLNGIDGGSGTLSQYTGATLVKRAANTWVATPLLVA